MGDATSPMFFFICSTFALPFGTNIPPMGSVMLYPNQTNECAKWRIPPSMIDGATYYANERGHIVTAAGYELADKFSPAARLNKGGSKHIHVTIAGKEREIHRFICAARWGIPRKGQECHHLNGNKFDNRPDNLIWLDREEHRLFDTVQRALRIAGRDLTQMSREEIIALTRQYRLVNPADRMAYDFTHHMEC